jgi:hypothetical protein
LRVKDLVVRNKGWQFETVTVSALPVQHMIQLNTFTYSFLSFVTVTGTQPPQVGGGGVGPLSDDPVINIRGYQLVKYERAELTCSEQGVFIATGKHHGGSSSSDLADVVILPLRGTSASAGSRSFSTECAAKRQRL